MAEAVGSKGKDRSLRDPEDPDPTHQRRFHPLGPVNGTGGANISGPYEPVLGWPVPPHPGEWRTGSGRGVYAESPDRVIVVNGGELPAYDQKGVWGPDIYRDLRFTEINSNKTPGGRHCHEIVVHDRNGAEIDNWDRWLDELLANDRRDGKKTNLGYINRIRVDRNDPECHVWIVGSRNVGTFKFTNEGQKLALKIDADSVPEQFRPYLYMQDVAFMPNGDFLIGNVHNLMRFSSDGEFVAMIGKAGTGPVEFDGIHGIEVHPITNNLYINDRLNERIQILDPDGGFIEQWRGFQGVYTIRLTADGQYLWTGNGYLHKFIKYDLTGKLIPASTWGTFGIAPGAIWGPHFFDTDSEGNLYIAEDYSGRVQKFRPMDDVDPNDPQLIGALSR